MKNVTIIMPDTLRTPMGGMGEQGRQILAEMGRLNPEYYFRVVGSSECGKDIYSGDNYTFYPIEDVSMPVAQLMSADKVLNDQAPFLLKTIEVGKPDLVHAFDWTSFVAGIYAARHFKVPLVITVQLSITQLVKEGVDKFFKKEPNATNVVLNKAIELQGFQNADAIIHVSNAYASAFPPMFDHKSFIVGNGVRLDEYSTGKRIQLPGRNKFKLLYIGRFDLMKNVQSLLCAKIPDNIDMLFVGGTRGSNILVHEMMLRACEKRDNFYYLGPKYGQEKLDIQTSVDAQIVPSSHEPFGIVALEALASRSILLSSFANGMADFLTEDVAINCGYFPDTISSAVQKAVDMSDDEKSVRIQRGLEICKEYTWESQAGKLLSIYSSLSR